MRTIACRMTLPGDTSAGTGFQTSDLESWPDGGYEISPDGRLSLVAPSAWGDRLPTQCGPISFTGVLRFYATSGPRAGCERRGFVAEFKDGLMVSGPRRPLR